MTDARLPGRWLTDPIMDGLSDRAWRTFTGSLMWSNEAGTDGRVPKRSMRLLHPEGIDTSTLSELVEVGLWEPAGADVQIPEWAKRMGQQTAEQIERQREFNRQRQQAHRSKSEPVTRDITRDVTRDVTRESLGQDRIGQDRLINNEIPQKKVGLTGKPPQYCSRHPVGTTEPCIPCRDARIRFEEWDQQRTAQAERAALVPPHADERTGFCAKPGHDEYPLPCDRCLLEAAS